MKSVKCFINLYAKAIAGAAAAGVMYLANRYEISLGAEFETGISAAVIALVVYFVPNTDCEAK